MINTQAIEGPPDLLHTKEFDIGTQSNSQGFGQRTEQVVLQRRNQGMEEQAAWRLDQGAFAAPYGLSGTKQKCSVTIIKLGHALSNVTLSCQQEWAVSSSYT